MGKALMIIVVGFSMIFSTITFTLTSRQSYGSKKFYDRYDELMTKNIYDSAANISLSRHFRSGGLPRPYVFEYFQFNGFKVFSYAFEPDPEDRNSRYRSRWYKPEATRFKRSIIFTTVSDRNGRFVESDRETHVKRAPFSYYQYLIDDGTASNFSFSAGDTLTGAVHSNNTIRTDNRVVFKGNISAVDQDAFSNSVPQAYGNIEFGAKEIMVPDMSDMISWINGLDARWTKRDISRGKDVRIVLTGTTYTLQDSVGNILDAPRGIPSNKVFVNDDGFNVFVEGFISRRAITIYSGKNIIIDDDLTYSGSMALLGLIAANDVIFSYQDENPDLIVQAAILASKANLNGGNLKLRNVNNVDSLALRLYFTGSLSAVKDQLTQIDATGMPINSFTRKHRYDPKLKNNRPPWFPETSRWEIAHKGRLLAPINP